MKTEIKEIYKTILSLNLQINGLLNNFPKNEFNDFNEKLQEFIEQKGQFIQKLIELKENFKEELKEIINNEEIQEISAQIDNYEKDNVILIQEKKVGLSNEIRKTDKSAKALSAYKFDKQDKPRLIDETE